MARRSFGVSLTELHALDNQLRRRLNALRMYTENKEFNYEPPEMIYDKTTGDVTILPKKVKTPDTIIKSINDLEREKALITAGIGGFHAGVEQGWWEGPQSCTSASIDNLSTEELLAQIMSAPMVRCDEIPWQMFGLSMAGWNMVVSICLAVLWTIAIKQQRA